MKERSENSVLTSLKDLRSIEEDRLRSEDEARLARIAAEEKARLEAAELARKEAAQRLEAEASAAKAAEEVRHKEEREAALRLAQAEAAARVEAETRLEAERMRLELSGRAGGGRRHLGVAAMVIGVVLVLGGGSAYLFGIYLPGQEAKREAAERARIREVEARAEADRKALLERLSEQEKRLQGAIASAQSAAEVSRLQQQLDALKKEKAAATSPPSAPRGREVRPIRRPPRPVMDAPAMKPDPDVRNSALRGLFGDN